MGKRKQTVIKLAQTALLAALCFVSFTFLQIKIPMPGGDATSLHIGNAFCVLAALLLGGVYCRGAENIHTEILYWSDCRSGGTPDRKDQ